MSNNNNNNNNIINNNNNQPIVSSTQNIRWGYFKVLIDKVVWHELSTLSIFFTGTVTVQFALFFWLMYDWPGMTNWFMYNRCESVRYISENIELNKGTASIMIISTIPSWIILGIISSYEPALTQDEITRVFTRPLTNFFSVLAYLGSVGVVLFDQQLNIYTTEQRRQHDMHVLSAFMLSLSYVTVHTVLSFKFNFELHRISGDTLDPDLYNKLRFFFGFACIYSVMNIFIFMLYCLLFTLMDCNDIKVYLEYILYFAVTLFNVVLYSQFSVVHILAKLDFNRKTLGTISI